MSESHPRVFFQESLIGTKALILANVAVFLAMAFYTVGASFFEPKTDMMLKWGANFAMLTLDGQWWRLLTSCFLHFGVVHIGMNMVALWAIGQSVEKLFGTPRYLIVYFLSGLAGAVASVLVHPLSVGAGASGAIFGIFGALFGLVYARRKAIDPVILNQEAKGFTGFLLINLALGVTLHLDLAAHAGGLVVGLLCGYFFDPMRSARLSLKQIGTTITLSAAVAALYFYAQTYPLDFGADMLAERGWLLSERNIYDGLDMLDEAIEKNPKDAERFLHRSLLYTRLRKHREALADAKCAVALEPENPGLLLNLSECLSAAGDYAGALGTVNKAIAGDQTEAQCYFLRAKLNTQLGNFDKALADLDVLTRAFPERASEYRTLRATIYLQKGDPETALQQLSGEKLRFENFNERVDCGLILAAIYCELGRWDKANGMITQLDTLDLTGYRVERRKRAVLALGLSKYAQAQNDCLADLAVDTSKSSAGDYLYDAIVATLAYLARGDRSGAELLYAKTMAVSDRPEWPLPVLQYLNGKTTVNELAKAASSSSDRITDSLTYAAIYDIICGQREQALSRFDKVIVRGNCFSTEMALVRICRARMKASPPQL